MWHGVLAVCQRIAGCVNRTAVRASAPLQIIVLEERATPAVAANYLPPIQPPVTVLVAVAPMLQPNASPDTATTSVRRDLFGSGNAPVHANEWEDFIANDHAATNDAPLAQNDRPQENDDTIAAETAVVEVEAFLPYVD